MRVVIESNPEAVGKWAASEIAALVRRKPNAVLGLATGGTPIHCYTELIRMHREEGLDFSQVRSFNLDEYVGLEESHPQSYRQFMQQHLFEKININPQNTHVPSGTADDYATYCEQYEQRIKDVGGIDLQLLGIGRDGHVGFNEPGSSLVSRTRLKCLTRETIQDNARFFGDAERVPTLAVTMGVGTIRDACQCLLLAVGSGKATAVQAAVEGPVTAQVTASALQLHLDTTIVIDVDAAASLQRCEYYRDAEEVRRSRMASS